MAWPKGSYPEEYQYLSDDTHRKAADITADLLRQGMSHQTAVRLALERAISWSRQRVRGGQPIRVVVAPCEGGWSVRTEGADQAAMTLPNKEQALARGRQMAEQWEAEMIVQGQEGEIHGRDG